MAKAIGWLILIALDIPSVIFRGLVLSALWLWFIVPLGVPAVGIAWGIGIALLVGLITKNPHVAESDADEEPLVRAFTKVFSNVFVSLLAWGMGALVHGFM